MCQPEVTARELPVGMQMHGQALAQVEELHEHLDVRAVSGDVRGPEPCGGIGGDGIAQVSVTGKHAQSLGLLTESRGGGANPLLRPLRAAGATSQGTDAVTTAIEVVELVDGQQHGRHGHASHPGTHGTGAAA